MRRWPPAATVTGIIPRRLVDRELAHPGLTTLLVVETLHERKAEMARLADGFIALPGGLGTLEELAEVASWAQLGCTRSRSACSATAGYWAALLAWLDRAVREGFVRPEHAAFLPGRGSVEPARPVRRAGRRRAIAGRAASSARRLTLGTGEGDAGGQPTGVPPGREQVGGHRQDRLEVRILAIAVLGRVGWTSGNLMTARVIASLPGLVQGRREGRQAFGREVRPDRRADRLEQRRSCQNRLPPEVAFLRRADRISCCRAARVKSLSPLALRTRA